jgi:hypothetical protein
MVGRGVVWAAGSWLVLSFFACGGRSEERAEGDGNESETGGGTTTGGRVGTSGTGGAMTPGAGRMNIGGVSQGGSSAGGASGAAGMCLPYEALGGRIGADGCATPWWGTSLEESKGVTACSAPYDPAMLAYGQVNYPPCVELSGPFAEGVSSDGGHECCYRVDEHACCALTGGYDVCISVPTFGDGTRTATFPQGQLDDPFYVCDGGHGDGRPLAASEAAERLIGVWVSCGSLPEPFLGSGFVFQGDGSFHVVEFTDDFDLREVQGCMQGGLWGFLNTTGQLNLYVEDLTHPYLPLFTNAPNEWLLIDGHELVRAEALLPPPPD